MISLPNTPKVTQKEGNKVVLEIDSLFPGYGITVGNSLRRVLLSSLEGAAVTQVKIKNVSHEFSTIPGIMEDVITIMLNLKQLRFKVHADEPQKAVLKIKGEKKVKASDFEIPSQIELVNKDAHIATLTSKSSELEMEITIEKGTGYSARESRGKEKTEIGSIALDAIYTPVKKVSYRVESMRVGERTDYDRLFLEIETDGTLSPEAAFSKAAEILVSQFSLLKESFQEKAEEEKPKAPKKAAAKKPAKKAAKTKKKK
ncbi:MAG: DNA-directed RNA polymerase subunit alpha [Candidatus Paceibacterota bacterium]|jgi:DNA-directed RNA polymerase subunit alpha